MTTLYLTVEPRFALGQVCATPGFIRLGLNPLHYLARHLTGDWGEMCAEDRQANEDAIIQGLRIFSAYDTPEGRIWVITEADRSVTTLLLPDEY